MTKLSRKHFLKMSGLGTAALVTLVLGSKIFQQLLSQIREKLNGRKNYSKTLKPFEFKVKRVNIQGHISSQHLSQAKFFEENLGNDLTLSMVSIPGGQFLMGTEDEEIERLVKKFHKDWFRREQPQHQVTVKPFFISKYPITQRQWRAIASLAIVERVLEWEPSHFKGDERPVEQVSWLEAVEFCQRLSLQTGKKYRLPTEAEWEYATRAGTTTPFYFGQTITTDLANYNGNYPYASEPQGKYRQETTAVTKFSPNGFGLYDLHGNVWEWCEDDWHPDYQGAPTDGSAWLSGQSKMKVRRGGAWDFYSDDCRCAERNFLSTVEGYDNIGFRVVHVIS